MDGEGRIVVGGRVGVLEAATLVDGDIHQHRSGLHLGDHVVGDELRGLGAGDEHRADHQIGLEDVLLHGEGGAHDTVYLVVEPPEGVAQLVEVGVENRDIRTETHGDIGRVLARDTATEDYDLGAGNATDAAHEDAAPTLGLHESVGTDLGGQGACDLGHGVEQRQRTGGQLNGLVGDRSGACLEQSIGLGTIGREVKVGEQGQVLTQVLVLAGDRLLHLDHHLANLPGVGGVADDLRTLRDKFLIRDRRTDARTRLDVDLVAPPDELMDANGGDGDPELVVLDLGRDCDTHVLLLRNCFWLPHLGHPCVCLILTLVRQGSTPATTPLIFGYDKALSC